MDIYLHLFLGQKIELSGSPSSLISSLEYSDQIIETAKEYQAVASSPSPIHGLVCWDAFKQKPASKESVLARSTSLWGNRDDEEKKRRIQSDLLEHEQECELYENEANRWISFFEILLIEKKIERIGFLFSDRIYDSINLSSEKILFSGMTQDFFRNIDKNILYTIK